MLLRLRIYDDVCSEMFPDDISAGFTLGVL
jgi:hypothetical protein